MQEKKLVILTGASSGIGKEMAHILANKGYSLVLIARSKDRLKKITEIVKTKSNAECEYFVCDISKEEDLEKLIQAYPDTDILINNAGYSMYGFYEKMEWSRQKDMIVVNALAPARLSHHYLQGMIKRNYGKILNVASTAGSYPTPFMSAYAAAKAFLIHLSEALALELKRKNITISCLLPGPTATDFWEVASAAKKVEKAIIGYDSAKQVAEFGIRLMEKGGLSGTPGWENKLKQIIKILMPKKVRMNAIRKHMIHKSL